MKMIYRAAIYCRISREDENNSSQSESIKNQIDFLTRYVLDQGWNIADIYTDDGYSGTNFDRPGFQRMLEDMEAGKVNLVITKDMSRLGRDYIETGRYIEKYFPEKNIRYIAVNDGIDTFEETSSNDMSPFKSVINDMYAKDISKKVRSVLKNKVVSGKFIGAFAPYGYKKDPNDKNRLLIDEAAAAIVRRIFGMYIEGHGLSSIAHILNDKGIPNPSAYKKTDCNYKNGTIKNYLWSHNSIKAILINPTYTGNLAQNKYKKVNYKSKKLLNLGKGKWIVVEGTHEPIVNKEDFELVQRMISRKNNASTHGKQSLQLFSGYVFCGDCGEYMTFSKTQNGTEYLICSKYKRYTSKYCTRHGIKVDELQTAVLEDLNSMIKYVIENQSIVIDVQKQFEEKSNSSIVLEMDRVNKKIEEINLVIKNLYLDKVKGILGESEFIALKKDFNKEKEALTFRFNSLQIQVNKQKEQESRIEDTFSLINRYLDINKLTREILERLIDRIDIFEDNSIKITYRFKNPLAA